MATVDPASRRSYGRAEIERQIEDAEWAIKESQAKRERNAERLKEAERRLEEARRKLREAGYLE